MIKHVVCWKLKESFSATEKKEHLLEMKKMLLDLKDKITCIQSIEVGINEESIDSTNFDIVLIAAFENANDLHVYQQHPEHKKVVEYVKNIRQERACVDFKY